MKKTLEEKLYERKIKVPNFFIYYPLVYFWKFLFTRKYKLKTTFIDDPREEKGSYLLLSNHASRVDYIFTAIPLLPHRFNFVVGYNEFFRSHLRGVLSILQEIPKKNFTNDIPCIMYMKKIITKKGRIIMFPEGMSSISGGSQPIAQGSGKLIKMLKVPVYVSNIKGAYLTNPKFNLTERPGPVEVTFKKLLDVDQIEKLSFEEIDDMLKKEIRMDDYKYNLEKQYTYKSDEIAKHIEQLCYKCPKCGSEFTLVSDSNSITCTHCGNKIYLDTSYNLTPASSDMVTPETPKKWFDNERASIKEEIKNIHYKLVDKVKIGFLPEYKTLKNLATSIIKGEGTIQLDRDGLHFNGTKDGKEFSFTIPTSDLPTYGMCTDASRFYTFLKGKFIEFYPERNSTIKWLLATEEMHRLNGGSWKNYPDDDEYWK